MDLLWALLYSCSVPEPYVSSTLLLEVFGKQGDEQLSYLQHDTSWRVPRGSLCAPSNVYNNYNLVLLAFGFKLLQYIYIYV